MCTHAGSLPRRLQALPGAAGVRALQLLWSCGVLPCRRCELVQFCAAQPLSRAVKTALQAAVFGQFCHVAWRQLLSLSSNHRNSVHPRHPIIGTYLPRHDRDLSPRGLQRFLCASPQTLHFTNPHAIPPCVVPHPHLLFPSRIRHVLTRRLPRREARRCADSCGGSAFSLCAASRVSYFGLVGTFRRSRHLIHTEPPHVL